MTIHYDFAVAGGDMRHRYLAEELIRRGYRVCQYALCDMPSENPAVFPSGATPLSSITELSSASCVISSIPLCRSENLWNQSHDAEKVPIHEILSHLQPGQIFFAGSIPESFQTAAASADIQVYDLMEQTSLSYFNTVATAEGAICEAIKQSPLNLRGSRCAVFGYGKCGQMICQYLNGILCPIYVVSEPSNERAFASLITRHTGTRQDFEAIAGQFDHIFNTIPAKILTAELLTKLKPSAVIIDIAFAPGGVDYEAARQLGIAAHFCPGLPGKYAPASSAEAIVETIEQILKEQTICL